MKMAGTDWMNTIFHFEIGFRSLIILNSIMLKLMVVVSVDTVTVMDIKFINVHEDNSAAKNMKTDSSSKKYDYYMEKEASDVSL